MMAVRAKATTGFSRGNAATSDLRVKPIARRAGATTSSALQIVGVSYALSASRSTASGRLGMAASSDQYRGSPGFMGNGRRHQGSSARHGLCRPEQQPKRNRQRQNHEHDRKTALGSAPPFPIGNPVAHMT